MFFINIFITTALAIPVPECGLYLFNSSLKGIFSRNSL